MFAVAVVGQTNNKVVGGYNTAIVTHAHFTSFKQFPLTITAYHTSLFLFMQL